MKRAGNVNDMWVVVLGSIVLLVGLSWLLIGSSDSSERTLDAEGRKQTLLVFCAAGMKLPFTDAVKRFEEEFDVKIDPTFGGSGTLLSQLRVVKKGDLYVAADTSYIELARNKYNLLDEAIPLARIRPVIAVQKGNPKNIRSIKDLLREGITFSLANPEAASVGKTIKKVLVKTGQWQQIESAAKVFKPTVNDVATDVLIGAVDAGVVWDATVRQYPKLDMVRTPEFDAAEKEVTIGVLKSCKNPTLALKFARYLQAPEKGQQAFKRHGFEVVKGDAWAVRPSILLYSGGVNRLAIQDTLLSFQQREGVEINVQYNGCGILVSLMKGDARPDAYFACDASYMTQVKHLFGQPMTISQTDMVIIVQKGNPKGIRDETDLARKKLRLGVANEKQSALGGLTRKLFEKIDFEGKNLYEGIQDNISVRTPTADLLVNQLQVGGLDAAVVYMANVASRQEKLDIIRIQARDPIAVQPIAVLKTSRYPHLTQRLVDALTSDLSRKRFEQVGFQWRAGAGNPLINDQSSKP